MKIVILLGLVIASSTLLKAQINAFTESGDEVLLYQDGTWEYVNDSLIEQAEIPINENVFTKDKKSSYLVKSKKLNAGVWINPKSWTFKKGTENDAFEFQFQRKGSDLYAMLISEKIQIPVETLKGIALQNARAAAPDIKLIKEEYRNVNGIKVLMLQMAGTIQGMRITYYGYYYSNSNGTVQFLTYTGENLFDGYLKDIEQFLNGFVEL